MDAVAVATAVVTVAVTDAATDAAITITKDADAIIKIVINGK